MSATDYLNRLNQEYLTVHRTKETFFWETYMGLSDDHQGSAQALTHWNNFLSQSSKIVEVREQIVAAEQLQDPAEKEATLTGLHGWLTTFEAHAIESQQALSLKNALIQFEGDLFEKKQKYTLMYQNEQGESVEGSLPLFNAILTSTDNEATRQSAHKALLDLEQWLLNNGFIELVKRRNAFARELGFANFFDYSVLKMEKMTSDELFTILDDFELRTRETNLATLKRTELEHGSDALLPHNLYFTVTGDVMREMDPYLPFAKSVRRWIESFGRLNIEFSDADLTLDLLDRKGKYQNGFCHGPTPSFYDQGKWIPAVVNFTSNAKPDQVGSGYGGINTLFHEGGHAAHFANVKMNAPCFSQEFAPTSMAYAETQSMFCDSLLNDADWLKTYAKDTKGDVIPDRLIKAMTDNNQPFKAYSERSILAVPYFERALYQLDDDALTPEAITQLARDTERHILGLNCSPRPLLSIPHLLSDESACAYQGYLLANMAVYQTRAYFTQRFGFLTDNPDIGPLLAQHYWHTGNSVSHDASIRSLTGEGFNAKFLADSCNLSADEAWQEQLERIASLAQREQAPVADLVAKIRIVDGANELANNDISNQVMCDQFEAYIEKEYATKNK